MRLILAHMGHVTQHPLQAAQQGWGNDACSPNIMCGCQQEPARVCSPVCGRHCPQPCGIQAFGIATNGQETNLSGFG